MQSVKGVRMFGLDQRFGFFFSLIFCFVFLRFCSVLSLLDLNASISFKLEL